MPPVPADRARSSSTATARSSTVAGGAATAGPAYWQLTRNSAKPWMSAENAVTEHPVSGKALTPFSTIVPAPSTSTVSSVMALTLTTTGVSQIGIGSPGVAMKRVPIGMQSSVGQDGSTTRVALAASGTGAGAAAAA